MDRFASSWVFFAFAWSRIAWNGREVDLGEQIALIHHLSFIEADFHDLAVDSRADRHDIVGLHLS